MSRACSVCTSKHREAIDTALVSTHATHRELAKRYGLDHTSIYRHETNGHIASALLAAKEAEEAASAGRVLGEVEWLLKEAKGVLAKAKKAKNPDASMLAAQTGAIREARSCVEMLAKLQGQLQAGMTININVHPQWLATQRLIIEALVEHPAARAAVVQALMPPDAIEGDYEQIS